MKDYLVVYEQAEDGGWGAHSPDVEGVFALGDSREAVEARMAEALAAHLEYLREQGRPVPEPHTQAGHVPAQRARRPVTRHPPLPRARGLSPHQLPNGTHIHGHGTRHTV